MKNKKKFTVVRSGQEKKNYWDFSPDDYCNGTMKMPLKTGDYSIKELPGEIITIERKFSVGEIYQNLFEKRFTDELDRLQDFKHKFILCQFDAKDVVNFPYNSGIPSRYWSNLRANGTFIMSKLSAIMVNRGIPVIFGGPGEPCKALAMSYLRHVARSEGLI